MSDPAHLQTRAAVGVLAAATVAHLVTLPVLAHRAFGAGPISLVGAVVAGGGVFYVLMVVAAVLGCVLAVALAILGAGRPEGRALAVFSGLLGLFWSAVAGTAIGPGRTGVLPILTAYATAILTTAALIRLAAVFPRRLSPDELVPERPEANRGLPLGLRWTGRPFPGPGVARALIAGPGLWIAAAALALAPPLAVWAQRQAPLPATPLPSVIWLAAGMAAFPLAVVGVRMLRMGYAAANPAQRRRALWAVAGFNAGAWLMALGLAIGVAMLAPIPRSLAALQWPLFGAVPVVVMLGLFVAVFRSGAVDPRMVIRGTVAYGALSVGLTFVFAGLESVFSELVANRLGLGQGGGTWLAAGAAAVLFAALRRTALGLTSTVAADGGPSVRREPAQPG